MLRFSHVVHRTTATIALVFSHTMGENNTDIDTFMRYLEMYKVVFTIKPYNANSMMIILERPNSDPRFLDRIL